MHQAHLLRMQGHVAFMWGLLGRFLATGYCMRPLLSLAGGPVPGMLTLTRPRRGGFVSDPVVTEEE